MSKNKPKVFINLDQPRAVRFGVNQLCELEDSLGVPIEQLDESKMGIKELRLFMFVGLKAGDPTLKPSLTLNTVGDWMDEAEDSMEIIGEKLFKALNSAFPEAQEQQTAQCELSAGEEKN